MEYLEVYLQIQKKKNSGEKYIETGHVNTYIFIGSIN